MKKLTKMLLATLILLGISEPKPADANGGLTEEVILVELEIGNILEVRRIEVPINKNPLAGGTAKTGGGSYDDKPGSYIYSLDTQELSKRKVKVHFTASFGPDNSIEKDFVVVRGKKSKHRFEHGISIIAYFGRATPNNSLNRTRNQAVFHHQS